MNKMSDKLSKTAQSDIIEPELRRFEGETCHSLRPLWEEVFYEDSKEFTDYYFQEKAARNHGFSMQKGDMAVAMLYLSPYPVMLRRGNGFDCQEINYIVGVATKKKYRHRGYMDKLLKAALQDMYEKAQPFTFLMPADPKIYQPYQFTYIYDRKEYKLRGENPAQAIENLCIMEEENVPCLAEFAQGYMEEHYDVFLRREEAYYRVMKKELRAQKGDICLIEEKGGIKGYFLYTQENGKCEIQESVFVNEKDGKNDPTVPTGVKTPIIMARIVDVRVMLSLLRTKGGEVVLHIRVSDSILEGNDGIWEGVFSEDEAKICKREQDSGKAAELVAASREKITDAEKMTAAEAIMVADISVDALASWIFGYRTAKECFGFETGMSEAEREKILYQIHKIKRLKRVFMNEIV